MCLPPRSRGHWHSDWGRLYVHLYFKCLWSHFLSFVDKIQISKEIRVSSLHTLKGWPWYPFGDHSFWPYLPHHYIVYKCLGWTRPWARHFKWSFLFISYDTWGIPYLYHIICVSWLWLKCISYNKMDTSLCGHSLSSNTVSILHICKMTGQGDWPTNLYQHQLLCMAVPSLSGWHRTGPLVFAE